MQSLVSVRGQTVIPKEVRKALGVKAGAKLTWIIKDRSAVVFPVPVDPVAALQGILKDSGYTFEDFMSERNEERKRERLEEKEEEGRWRATSSIRRR